MTTSSDIVERLRQLASDLNEGANEIVQLRGECERLRTLLRREGFTYADDMAELAAEITQLKAVLDKIYNSHPDEAADIARVALEDKPEPLPFCPPCQMHPVCPSGTCFYGHLEHKL